MITVYDIDTGKIKYVVDGDPLVIETTKENSQDPWIEGNYHWDTHYVFNGDAVKRPECPVILQGKTIVNVPVPAKITINGVDYDTNEAEVELDFNFSGIYNVKVLAFPYLDKEFQIENTTP